MAPSKVDPSKLNEARKSTVFDANSNTLSFGQVLDNQHTRTLVVFIRHFFCGNCQEYVRRLSTDLAPSSLPKDLSIVIVGCGAPSLIPSYVQLTGCPFEIYADPSTQLYKQLGMQRSLSLGPKDPAYIQHSLASGVMKSIVQGIKRIPSGDVAKAGDLSVNGGEFLFARKSQSDWTLTWSHYMMNSRDHSEINTLKLHLDLLPPESQVESRIAESLQDTREQDSTSCSDMSEDDLCGKSPQGMRRSFSMRRKSWMVKAGQLTRSSSLRRNVIQIA